MVIDAGPSWVPFGLFEVVEIGRRAYFFKFTFSVLVTLVALKIQEVIHQKPSQLVCAELKHTDIISMRDDAKQQQKRQRISKYIPGYLR